MKNIIINGNEALEYIKAKLSLRNHWQKRYVEAAYTLGHEREAEISKQRAIRAEREANAIISFLEMMTNVTFAYKRDYETDESPKGYHPINTLIIKERDESENQIPVTTISVDSVE